jgi:hypothetical protein
MASVIDRVSTRPRYPWKKWADGKARRAKQGRDFSGDPRVFRNTLYVHATRNELSVTVHIEERTVEFQFFKRRKRKQTS